MEAKNKAPIIIITEGIGFFLAGGFLVGTSSTINSNDLLIQRLTYVAQYTGYVLLAFGVIYVLALIKWFSFIKNKLNKWAIYVYPLVFGITSLQVLQSVFDSKQSGVLRWLSGVFVVIIIGLVIFTSSGKTIDKAHPLSNLILTYVGLAIILIALRAENFLALIQPNIVQPLVFLIVSFICGLLLYKQIGKKEE